MKKTIYTLALGALLLAGCSQEESLATGEEVKVTFTANVSNGVQSRADGEAVVNVDKLICAVYKQTGTGEKATLNTELIRETVDVDGTTGKATFSPTLLKGHKYGIVFWAYNSDVTEEQRVFDVSELNAIKFTPKSSPEGKAYDVYTKTVKDITTQTKGDNLKVTLVRPLAQINIATTESDWNYVNNVLKETPGTSTLTIEKGNNVYNALTEEFSHTDDGVTYNYTIGLGTKKLDDTKYILGTGYTFPGSIVECSLSVKNNDVDNPVEIYSLQVQNVPTSANYRTNIVPGKKVDANGNEVEGGLMTGSVSYEVTISEGYTETVNKTPEELEEEANQNNQGNNE